uniref:Uncharacterized protein n=1 Tax=Cannabis sativa TaxID=3483 RepID=A0A803Q7T6_CANSA
MVERHKGRSVDFLLNETNLKTVRTKQSTCDYKNPKFSKWQQILIPPHEEDRDYVARIHYLNKVAPREAEEEAPQGNNCGWSPTVLRTECTSLDMDLDLEDMLNSPILTNKKSKK